MKIVIAAVLVVIFTGMAYAGCPEGFTFNAALQKCETAPTCPPGFVLHKVDDICCMKSNEGKCPNGAKFNKQENTCEAQLVCPEGTLFEAEIDKCIRK